MTPAQIRKWRFYAESLIEQAIEILDTIDGDADLENGGDSEPDGQDEPAINDADPLFQPAPSIKWQILPVDDGAARGLV